LGGLVDEEVVNFKGEHLAEGISAREEILLGSSDNRMPVATRGVPAEQSTFSKIR
jgi:hypothetical protein